MESDRMTILLTRKEDQLKVVYTKELGVGFVTKNMLHTKRKRTSPNEAALKRGCSIK
jgi:hypothetical protein